MDNPLDDLFDVEFSGWGEHGFFNYVIGRDNRAYPSTDTWLCQTPNGVLSYSGDYIRSSRVFYRVVYYSPAFSQKYVDHEYYSCDWQVACSGLISRVDANFAGPAPLPSAISNSSSDASNEFYPESRVWHQSSGFPQAVWRSDDGITLFIERTRPLRMSKRDRVLTDEEHELTYPLPVFFDVATRRIYYSDSKPLGALDSSFDLHAASETDTVETGVVALSDPPNTGFDSFFNGLSELSEKSLYAYNGGTSKPIQPDQGSDDAFKKYLLAEVERLTRELTFANSSKEDWLFSSYRAFQLLVDRGWVPPNQHKDVLDGVVASLKRDMYAAFEKRLRYVLQDCDRKVSEAVERERKRLGGG